LSAVIPEVIVQAAIVEGMKHLRQEPQRFGQLFRDFPKSKRDEIVGWFADDENRIRLTFGFPRQDADLPVISIRVLGDSESTAFIGDQLSSNVLPTNAPVQWGDSSYYSDVESIGDGVTYKTTTTEQTEDVLGGTLDPQADNREVGDGGDPMFKDTDYVEESGAYYQAELQVQVVSDIPELVVVLTHVMRAILHRSRMFMERNGLINVVIGRKEYAPMAGYFPVIAFSQAVSLQFTYLFSEPSAGASISSLSMVLESLNFVGDLPLVV